MNKKVEKFVKDHKYELIGAGAALSVIIGKRTVKYFLKHNHKARRVVQKTILKTAAKLTPLVNGEEVCAFTRKTEKPLELRGIMDTVTGKQYYIKCGRYSNEMVAGIPEYMI